jgi:hypothetical protein
LYVATAVADPPTFSFAAGTYNSILQLELNDNINPNTLYILGAPPIASIFYTTDGSTQTALSGIPYLGAIAVNATEKIRAVADGPETAVSPVASAKYVIHLPLELPLAHDEWAWESGSATEGHPNSLLCYDPPARGVPGTYGSLGVPGEDNVPGSRNGAAQWTDKSGNFGLFGGTGFDSQANCTLLNDLWKFNPTSREWTWVGGSDATSYYQAGVYGTLGKFAAGNMPGSRQQAVSWTDRNGHLWLFGGVGYDSTNNYGYFGDIWEFNPSTREWAWMGGSNTVNPSPVYGELHVPAAANTHGGRSESAGWTD